MSTDTDIIITLARKLEAENTRLRAENTALRAGQGTWPDGDSPAGEQVPRVISAAELIHGMWVAGKREDGTWTAGTVNGNSSIISRGGLRLGSLADFGQFVLLEDAPGPFVMADWERELLQEKAEAKPAPRLTVHALNTAPVGSRVYQGEELCFIKENDGEWSAGFDLTRPSEWILRSIPNATLTHPEATA